MMAVWHSNSVNLLAQYCVKIAKDIVKILNLD